MSQLRVLSVLIAATVGVSTSAAAHMTSKPQWGGSHQGYGMPETSRSTPKYSPSASGCCGQKMSGGHAVWLGGKMALGMHEKGLHFYGMRSGGSAYGGEGKSYGGAKEMHPPLGTHMIGMHYYGMNGGDLAAKYGHMDYAPEDLRLSIKIVGGYGKTPSDYGKSDYEKKASYWAKPAYEAKPVYKAKPVYTAKPAYTAKSDYKAKSSYKVMSVYHAKSGYHASGGGTSWYPSGSGAWGTTAFPSSMAY